MTDINNREVRLGSRVLVAYQSSGYVYLQYGIITSISDNKYQAKVKFDDDRGFKTKTLKMDGKHKLIIQDEGYQ